LHYLEVPICIKYHIYNIVCSLVMKTPLTRWIS